ncbi:DUF4097 family beta strand repeat-containing protein [Haloarcula marina]|uniref:DUF4097 family beta strand repeat-containing protein n=1 Tax=Haloarcula marina TaxID=2961574 RepID=UPI0020B874E7|nr:DUF4097 family beta strand repeat-containing protein [Halomicroarcula marina]
MNRRGVLVGAGAAVTGALSGCAEFDSSGSSVTASVSETYDISRETVVTVSNRNGDITVGESDSGQLRITGTKRAGSQAGLDSISIGTVEGDRFVVDGRFESGAEFESRRLDFTIGIPTGVSVDTVSTANGSVTIRNVRGNVSATTANGTVVLDDVSGTVRCESGNGDVRARETTGLVSARTASGDVDVDVLSMPADVTCRAGTGDVTVRVGPNVSGEMQLRTARGSVSVTDLPYTATTERPGYIVGRLRDGGETALDASSSDGDIALLPASG